VFAAAKLWEEKIAKWANWQRREQRRVAEESGFSPVELIIVWFWNSLARWGACK